MLCLLQFLFCVQRLPERIIRIDRHFHIGLACAHPDFADENVVKHDGWFCAVITSGERIWAACVHERESDGPFAVFINGSFSCFVGECDGEFLAWFPFAREDDRPFALQDHVGGKDVVEAE